VGDGENVGAVNDRWIGCKSLDKPRWHGMEVEKLSVTHAYNQLKDMLQANTSPRWTWIWSLETSAKVQACVWKLWHKALPTKELLRTKGMKLLNIWPGDVGNQWHAEKRCGLGCTLTNGLLTIWSGVQLW